MGILDRLKTSRPFEDIVRAGNVRAATSALRRGVPVEEINNCLGFAQHAGLPMVKLLVEHGADVNHGRHNRRPLHLAALSGYEDIAEYLIDMGADVNAADGDGDTPLDAAFGSPLDEDMLALHGRPLWPGHSSRRTRQKAVAAVISKRGGKGGHAMPPHLWGPLKSRIDPLVLTARMSFPQATADEIVSKVLEKFNLQFEPGVSPDRQARIRQEVRAAIVKAT